MNSPRYVQIAADIRQRIASGDLQPGDRIPSQPEMMHTYGVSDGVAKAVVRALATEGLVVSKPGSGVFVRRRPATQVLTRTWFSGMPGRSPFAADMTEHGRRGDWTYRSQSIQAPPEIRDRLGLEPPSDEPDVMETAYVFRADGEAVMLSTSYEPYSLTRGTAVVFPEEGPGAGMGVVERMALIGIEVSHGTEIVTARTARAEEASGLGSPANVIVMVLRRTYYAGERPVETADIVIPTDRYELLYGVPVRGGVVRLGED